MTPGNPRRRVRRGLSLLEVLVGMTILSVAGIAVLGALRQSAQEVDTTSDYTVALGLSQRLVEESLQAAADNPHLSRESTFWGTGRGAVKEGGHPRMEAFEDTARPWGRIENRSDLAVDPRDPNLFRLYRDFSLELAPKAVAGNDGLIEVELKLDCPGVKDARVFRVPYYVAKPQIAPEVAPPVAQDPAGLDDAIKKLLYPGQGGGTLESVTASVGADVTAVRDLGGVLVVLQTAAEGLDAMDREIARCKLALAEPGRVEKLLEIAKLQERRTALVFRSLLWCRAPAGRINAGVSSAQLGGRQGPTPAWIAAVLRRGVELARGLEQGTAEVQSTLLAARRSMANGTMRAFRQLALERKILEIAKLRALMGEGRGLEFVQGYALFLDVLYKGRNRNVEEFLARETAGIRSLDALRAMHPVVAQRVEACAAAAEDLYRLRERLP